MPWTFYPFSLINSLFKISYPLSKRERWRREELKLHFLYDVTNRELKIKVEQNCWCKQQPANTFIFQRPYPKLLTSKQCENTAQSQKSIQYPRNIIEKVESNKMNLPWYFTRVSSKELYCDCFDLNCWRNLRVYKKLFRISIKQKIMSQVRR